jgi:CelD/BcsL family acetyltransferase involved in cellulose biosynthesis
MMSERVEWIEDETRFAQLAAAWDALAAEDPSPFARHGWLTAWWRWFGDGRALRVAVLWRGEQLSAALPLCADGRRLQGLANAHTPELRAPARDAAALASVVSAAVDAGAHELALSSLPHGGELPAALSAELRQRRWPTIVGAEQRSPIAELGGGYDAWRADSRPRWGAPLERFGRKLERDHGATFQLVERPADLERELEHGFAVEASGWKGEHGTAIVSSPQTLGFYTDVARTYHRLDALRLSRIDADGRTVAFDFSLLHRGRLYLLKTGFDEQLRKLAPGLVLRLRMIERCCELGLEAHELLGDADAWKLKFATTDRLYEGLHAYAPAPAPLLRYAGRRARSIAGRAARRAGVRRGG